MSKISNLIDFYNGKSLNKDKIPGNSKKLATQSGKPALVKVSQHLAKAKFKIPDYPKPRKKEVSQLTTLSNSDINLICNTLKYH